VIYTRLLPTPPHTLPNSPPRPPSFQIHSFAEWQKRKGAANTANQQNYGTNYANTLGDAENLFMKGKLCIQIFSGGVTNAFRVALEEAGQEPRAMYFLDPWRLVQDGVCKNGEDEEPPDERVDHVTYGQRMMMAIALRLKNIGLKHSKLPKNDPKRDEEASKMVRNAYIVMHVNHEVESRVVEDLVGHMFYGFDRNKVVIIPETMMPGCAFHPGRGELMADRTSRMIFYGTGYKMLQLGWAGEGYLVNRKGRRQWLGVSALEFLKSEKVEWMTTTSINDFTQLEDNDLAVDFDRLSYTLHLSKKNGCNGTLEVDISAEDYGSGTELPPGFAFAFQHPDNEEYGMVAPMEYYSSAEAKAALDDYNTRAAMKDPYVAPLCLLRFTYKVDAVAAAVKDKSLPLHLGRDGCHAFPSLTAYDILSNANSKISLISRGTERFGVGKTAFVSSNADIDKSMEHVGKQDVASDFNTMVEASGAEAIRFRGTTVEARVKFAIVCDGSNESHAAFDLAQCFVRQTCDVQNLVAYVDPDHGLEAVNFKNKQLETYQPEQKFVDTSREVVTIKENVAWQGMFVSFCHMFLQDIAVLGRVEMKIINAIRIPILVCKGIERLADPGAEEEEDDVCEIVETPKPGLTRRASEAFDRRASNNFDDLVAAQHVDDVFDTDKGVRGGEGSIYKRLPPRRVGFITRGRNTEMSIAHIKTLNKLLRKGTDQIYIFACMPYENKNRKGAATASRQTARRKLVAEVRKMESVCNQLEMFPVIVDIVAPELTDAIKHLDKYNIDIAAVNGNFNNEEDSATVTDEVESFIINNPKSTFVYKHQRIPEPTADERAYYLNRTLATFEGKKAESNRAAFE